MHGVGEIKAAFLQGGITLGAIVGYLHASYCGHKNTRRQALLWPQKNDLTLYDNSNTVGRASPQGVSGVEARNCRASDAQRHVSAFFVLAIFCRCQEAVWAF